MTRILHVTDVYRPAVGGIEVFVGDLAARQAAAGHDVTVLTPWMRDGAPRVDREDGFTVHRAGRWSAAASRRLLGRFLEHSGAGSVVHAHLSVFSPFSTMVARAAVATGTPAVLTVHSMLGDRHGVVRIVGGVVGWNRWPSIWTTVSEAAAADLRGLLPAGAPVSVVPNAIDVDWWRQGRPDRHRGPVTVLSVMRLVPRKRPLALLSMLTRLRDEVDPRTPLAAWIVGDGPLQARMEEELRRTGLSSWVTLTGGLDRTEIRGLCRSADLYVAPATRESFGIAALEARAAGLPVVAMRSGGVGEFVRHGVEGLLCEDDDDMVRSLAGLAADGALRGSIAARNRLIRPALDWNVVVAGFDRAYAAADAGRAARAVPSDPMLLSRVAGTSQP